MKPTTKARRWNPQPLLHEADIFQGSGMSHWDNTGDENAVGSRRGRCREVDGY